MPARREERDSLDQSVRVQRSGGEHRYRAGDMVGASVTPVAWAERGWRFLRRCRRARAYPGGGRCSRRAMFGEGPLGLSQGFLIQLTAEERSPTVMENGNRSSGVILMAAPSAGDMALGGGGAAQCMGSSLLNSGFHTVRQAVRPQAWWQGRPPHQVSTLLMIGLRQTQQAMPRRGACSSASNARKSALTVRARTMRSMGIGCNPGRTATSSPRRMTVAPRVRSSSSTACADDFIAGSPRGRRGVLLCGV